MPWSNRHKRVKFSSCHSLNRELAVHTVCECMLALEAKFDTAFICINMPPRLPIISYIVYETIMNIS